MELRLDTTKNLWENVQALHERLKKLKKKRERLIKLIEEEKKRPVKEEKREAPIIKKRRKREWYEAFRWMITSGGRIVIGGRDARTNEMIIRRYLENNDLVFHADVVGAPTVLLKNGRDASPDEITETARFAASYSRAWKMGLHRVPVFYVEPSQVSLAPPSGEYRPKGGLIVKGKRNWLEVEIYLYLGFKDDRFFVSAVKRDDVQFLLLPGREDRLKTARLILSQLNLDKSYLNELVPLLPPGDLEVKRIV